MMSGIGPSYGRVWVIKKSTMPLLALLQPNA